MSDGIPGHCFTNLDEYRNQDWPKRFVSMPRKGDRVQSVGGKTLVVVGLTHEIYDGSPRVRIELHR